MNRFSFNVLDYPLCLEKPRRLTNIVSWQEHIPFAFAIVQMMRPRSVLELGTHRGDSYCAFCQAVQQSGVACVCSAVDSWEGDEEAGLYGPEVLEELRSYHDPLYGSFSRLIKSRFDDALTAFPDRTIDLLHIDGLHTYEAARHDFETWLPKMSDRGVVLLHDTDVRESDFGVWRLWEELSGLYPSFRFYHGNGLGVLGVGNALPESFIAFFAMSAEYKKQVADLFYCLGSRLTVESRVRREKENEHLEKMLEGQTRHIQALIEHSRNLEGAMQELQRQNERLRDVEPRLLASLEQNSFLAAHIEDMKKHVANLERIVNHPLVKFLRAGKGAIKARS